MDWLVRFIDRIPTLYQYLLALAFVIAGAAIYTQAGKKWGFVVIALGILWFYLLIRPLI